MSALLLSLWRYRGFVLSSIRNEFVTRFARSRLGGLWMIIHPLAQVAIYALILSNVLAAKLPGIDNKYAYAIYLMAGMLAWNLFAEIVGRCVTLFIEQGNLMKKIVFPRIALPAIVVGSSVLNNGMLFVAMLGVFALLGHPPGIAILWLPLLAMVVVALALGLGLVLGVLNVFIRDIGQVVPIVLQVLFWFTPIVYPVNIIPEAYRHLLALNPMFPVVNAYQQAVVYGARPDLGGLGVIALFALGLLGLGLFLFRKASGEMVDAL
ncbi:ABC transporter permease [Zeimonas arvi]|uniref:Transport permease protein n=1 Tax=Zeimonas arvi TaxID=2498847 RepID=A0A5C8NYM3_9BURK|nr:ABC transporter permease [Zeimonas arvi]TXL66353.1 ABC transporter permease [Zeimonas arvi]